MRITKKVFRILKDVSIVYSKCKKYEGSCCISPKVKTATIYPCPEDIDGDIYRIHELLHIALRKLELCKEEDKNEAEENLIQDIVALMKGV